MHALAGRSMTSPIVSSAHIRSGCCLAVVAVALGPATAAAFQKLPGPSRACPWVQASWGVTPQFTITRTGVWNAGNSATLVNSVTATETDTALPVRERTANTSSSGVNTEGACAPATFNLNDSNLPAKAKLSGTWVTPTGSGTCRSSGRWGSSYYLLPTFNGKQFHVTFSPRKRFAMLHLLFAFGRNLSCNVPGFGPVTFGSSNSLDTTFITGLLRVPVKALLHDHAFALPAAVKLTQTGRWNGGTETQTLVLTGLVRFNPTGCSTLTSFAQQPRKGC